MPSTVEKAILTGQYNISPSNDQYPFSMDATGFDRNSLKIHHNQYQLSDPLTDTLSLTAPGVINFLKFTPITIGKKQLSNTDDLFKLQEVRTLLSKGTKTTDNNGTLSLTFRNSIATYNQGLIQEFLDCTIQGNTITFNGNFVEEDLESFLNNAINTSASSTSATSTSTSTTSSSTSSTSGASFPSASLDSVPANPFLNINPSALSEALHAFSYVSFSNNGAYGNAWFVRVEKSQSHRLTNPLRQLRIEFQEVKVTNDAESIDITLNFENYQKLFLMGLAASSNNIDTTRSDINAAKRVTLYFSSLSDEFKDFLNRYQRWGGVTFTDNSITIDPRTFSLFNNIIQSGSNSALKAYLSAISTKLPAIQSGTPPAAYEQYGDDYDDDEEYGDKDDLTPLVSSSSAASIPNPMTQVTGSISTSIPFLTDPTVINSLKTFLTGQKNWHVEMTDSAGTDITGAENLSLDANGKLDGNQITVILNSDAATGSPTAGFLIFDDRIKFPPTLCNKDSYQGAYDMLHNLNIQLVDIAADKDNPKILKDLFLQAVDSGLIPIIQSRTGNANIQQDIIQRLEADNPDFAQKFQALLDQTSTQNKTEYDSSTHAPGRGFHL